MDPGDATRLLLRLEAGDGEAARALFDLLYDELRGVAAGCLAREREGHTLQPTALVHEAYVRLLGTPSPPRWENRSHFVRVFARAMRRVLVDHARARRTDKRGAGAESLPLDAVLASYEERHLDVLALHGALERLTSVDEPLAQVVELRFFAGLTIESTALVLGVSTPTVERRWRVARLWLARELEEV